MSKNKKPLFSKPVLAGIMVLSTLAIWALNASAPQGPSYPEIQVKKWQTQSAIPVVWLTQSEWQNNNQLDIRLSFHGPAHNIALTDATLSLMLDDPLPLISSTINQRLSPLTASVSSYYDHEGQTLDITTPRAAQYLNPTFDIVDQWLTQPQFKVRSFDRWQSRTNTDLPALHRMQTRLFHKDHQDLASLKSALTRQEVAAYYRQLTQNVSRITIVGAMDKATQANVKAKLNALTQGFAPSAAPTVTKPAPSEQSTHTPQAIIATAGPHQEATSKRATPPFGQIQHGMALSPLRSVKDWISLQIWGADIISTLRQQANVAYVQLNLILSPAQPWAWWRVQYTSQSTNTQATNAGDTTTTLNAQNVITIKALPSVMDKQRFDTLLASFETQIADKAKSPRWWSKLTSEVTQPYGHISPTQFAEHYQQAIATFTQEDYQQALHHLFIPSSYQENQVQP